MNVHKVVSYQAADFIDIKNLRQAINGNLLYKDASELFYEMSTWPISIYIQYTALSVFSIINLDEISSFFGVLQPYCRNFFTPDFNDELVVETNATET